MRFFHHLKWKDCLLLIGNTLRGMLQESERTGFLFIAAPYCHLVEENHGFCLLISLLIMLSGLLHFFPMLLLKSLKPFALIGIGICALAADLMP
jgi:hypothetical protein